MYNVIKRKTEILQGHVLYISARSLLPAIRCD